MGIRCGPINRNTAFAHELHAANKTTMLQPTMNTFSPEIIGHPLMDAFIEWDNGRTDYQDTAALATIWAYFLRERPDINTDAIPNVHMGSTLITAL